MYRDINMTDTTTILPIYHNCDVCKYTSILKANYDRHMLTKKHLKNIEKYNEKIMEETEKDLEKDESDSDSEGESITKEQLHKAVRDTYDEVNKKYEKYGFTKVYPDECDYVYASKIYNTLYELKRQYPDKYQFVRNYDRLKREWRRWEQEKYDNDYVYCYAKWFKGWLQVNNELISKFVF